MMDYSDLKQEDIDLVASLVGRTIVGARWYDANPEYEWTEHGRAELTLDDGRKVTFGGWGHDASGAQLWVDEP